MVRELSISIYLFIFAIIFNFFKILPTQKKITYCVSFIENNTSIYNEFLKHNQDIQSVFITNNTSSYHYFNKNKQNNDLCYSLNNIASFLRVIYHLATSQIIIVDNYYGFLSVANFKKEVKCLQIWHAVGALKQFGWKDPSITHRTKKAKNRFKNVYEKFDYILIGSKKMQDIFNQSFGTSKEKMIPTGIPRTDIFFKTEKRQSITYRIYNNFPEFKNKKIILYAPTFRDGHTDNFHLPLDLELLKQELNGEYVIILKLHPNIKSDNSYNKYTNFIYDLSYYPTINDLLFVTDYLITDYSSIPFEYSFFQKPMIFYPYDIEEYSKLRGFPEPYEKMVPGPIAHSTSEICRIIKNNNFDLKKIKDFHKIWNEYSLGDASEKTVKVLLEWLNESKK